MDHIVFADGYSAQLQGLYQRQVYGGLIEGVPDAQINRRYMEDEPLRAQRLFGGAPVRLIEPTQTPIMNTRGQVSGMRLPSFVCVGLLHHPQAAHHLDEPYMYWSEAIVIWYQERLAMPIDAQVLTALERLAWVSLSRDLER